MPYQSRSEYADRAALRAEKQRSLSPDEFNAWEYGEMQKNRGERPTPFTKAKMPGASDDRDELVRASALELGIDKPKEYTPEYINGEKTGRTKKAGIYVPEGGAFSSGEPTKQIAAFDSPDEKLLKDTAGLRASYNPDQKRALVAKARGLPMPEETAAQKIQKKMAGLNDVMNLFQSSKMKGATTQPTGSSFTTNNTGQDDFIGGLAKNFQPGPLEQEAEKAPAVAFNGTGPLAPTERPQPKDAARMEGGGFNQELLNNPIARAFIEQEMGIKLPPMEDPRKRAQEEENVNWEREQRRVKSAMAQMQLEEMKTALAAKKMTPGERARANMEVKRLEREAMREGMTEDEKLEEEARLVDARTKVQQAKDRAEGKAAPVSEEQARQANIKTREAFRGMYKIYKDGGASHEEATQQALNDVNLDRKDGKLPLFTAEDVSGTPNFTGPGVTRKRLASAGLKVEDVAQKMRDLAWESRGNFEKLGMKLAPGASFLADQVMGVKDSRINQLIDSNEKELFIRMQDMYPDLTPEDFNFVVERAKAKGL